MIIINGPGFTAPVPQNLYPTQLNESGGIPPDAPSNYVTLNAGDALPIPAQSAQYLIDLGLYCSLEFLDAVTGIWRPQFDMSFRPGMIHMQTDGITKRIANRLGCPVSAIVAGGGSGFVQSTASITASAGGSTWVPVVGGNLSVVSVASTGANYTVPPIVLIPSPTPAGINASVGGVPATAYATLSLGTVASVSLVNFGAGYAFAPTPVLIPSPYDTALNSITQASISLVVNAANAAKITAALCTNFGAPLAALTGLTLTAAGGAGTGATITPQILQTITGQTVVAGGGGWGTATAPARVDPVGGGATGTAAAGFSNPAVDFSGFVPRNPALTGNTSASGGVTSVTFPSSDQGMYLTAPTAAIAPGGTLPTTLTSITFGMGSTFGTVFLQPL